MRQCNDCRRENDQIRKLRAEGANAAALIRQVKQARRDRAFRTAVDEMIRAVGGVAKFAQIWAEHVLQASRSGSASSRQLAISTALRFLEIGDRLRALPDA